MIIPTGPADKAFGINLQKINRISGASAVDGVTRKDEAMISNFSALVDYGRKCAMALPDTRSERVNEVRLALENGRSFATGDIASSMINNIVKGQV